MADINNTNTTNTTTTSAEAIRAMGSGGLLDYIKGQFSTAGLPIPQELTGVLNPPTPEDPAPAMESTPAPEENPVSYGVPTPQMLREMWAPATTQAPPQVSTPEELQFQQQQQQFQRMQQQMLEMQRQMELQQQQFQQQQLMQQQLGMQFQQQFHQQQQLMQQQLAEMQRREYVAKIASIDIEVELKKHVSSNPATVNFVKKFIGAITLIADAGGDPAAIKNGDDAATAAISMAKVAMKAAIEIAAEKNITTNQLKDWLYGVLRKMSWYEDTDNMVLDKLWEFLTR